MAFHSMDNISVATPGQAFGFLFVSPHTNGFTSKREEIPLPMLLAASTKFMEEV